MSSAIKLINLSKIFEALREESYCVIKLAEHFPMYQVGSDVDIFCLNVDKITSIILKQLGDVPSSDTIIKITKNICHVYIDIIHMDNIHFRFDLYGSIPIYKKVQLKESFFSTIIENSVEMKFKEEGFYVKIPLNIDDAILRYIEYQEWYSDRPDKIKHINYLNKKIEKEEIDINKLLDKLHYYISIPLNFDNRITSKNKYIRNLSHLVNLIRKGLFQLRSKGISSTFRNVKKHFTS